MQFATIALPTRMCVKGAAVYTGVSTSTLNKLRVYGGGPIYLKLGARVAYDVSDLDDWLKAARRGSTSEAPPSQARAPGAKGERK